MWLDQALTDYLQGFSCWTCNEKVQKSALETEPSKSEAKKASDYKTAEEENKCLAAEAAGEGGQSDEGASVGYVV